MGDRCMVSIKIHRDDVKKAAYILRTDNWVYACSDDAAIAIIQRENGVVDADDVNYGGEDVLGALAGSNVRYYGHHDAGSEYSPGVFFNQDARYHYLECGQEDVRQALIEFSKREDGTYQPDYSQINDAVNFFTEYDKTKKMVDESWT